MQSSPDKERAPEARPYPRMRRIRVSAQSLTRYSTPLTTPNANTQANPIAGRWADGGHVLGPAYCHDGLNSRTNISSAASSPRPHRSTSASDSAPCASLRRVRARPACSSRSVRSSSHSGSSPAEQRRGRRADHPTRGISAQALREDIGGGHSSGPDRCVAHLLASAEREADAVPIPR